MVNKKATLACVTDEIKPFLTKCFLKSPYIEKSQILPLAAFLTAKYSNVLVREKFVVDQEFIKIEVRRFLLGGKLLYEVRDHGVPIYRDPLFIPLFISEL